MSIKEYYNGTSVLERRNDDPPEDGMFSYDEPVTIGRFRRQRTQIVYNGLSERVSSNATYASDEPMREGDLIDGIEIVKVDAPHGGETKYWRAYV